MSNPEHARPVDPRAGRSRAAAVAAALQLLQEGGITRLSHQNIARRSGIGRSTVYRHWPTLADLVLELLVTFRMPDFERVDEPLRGRLRHNIVLQQRKLADPAYRSVYLAVQSVAQEDQIRVRLQEINSTRVRSVLDVLGPEFDLGGSRERVAELLALINGPLLQMSTFVGVPGGDDLVEAVIDSVLCYLGRSRGRD